MLAGILIGNVVEAYGAAQPIISGGHTKGFAIRLLGGIGVARAAVDVDGWLERYRTFWSTGLDALERHLEENP